MQSGNERLPVFKRVGGFLLIIIVLIASFLLGIKLIGMFSSHEPVPESFLAAGSFFNSTIAIVLSAIALTAAVVAYAVTFLTSCFTFDFNKPFFASFKKKLYLINIAVGLGLSLAIGFIISVPITPILIHHGLPEPLPFIIPILASLICVQLTMVWINIWAPLNRAVVRKRAIVLGVAPPDLAKGVLVGVSDPGKSSFKKLTLVEDDVGVLWIEPDRLVYRGDTENFVLKREDMISVKCKADAGSMASYAGAAYPILQYRSSDGSEQSIRLHSWGSWSLGELSKSLRLITSKLKSWQLRTPAENS